MVDDDPTDDLARVVMTLGAGSSRALEILTRNAQERKQQRARATEADTAQLLRRWEAQVVVAERTMSRYDSDFIRTADPDRVAGAYVASRTWAEVDPQRFGGHHDRIIRDVGRECGLSAEQLTHDPQWVQMSATGVATKIEQGRLVAQGVDPEAAAARVLAKKQTPYRAEENKPTRVMAGSGVLGSTPEVSKTKDSGLSR